MAKVNFIRKHTKAEVNDEPIVDGNFIVTGEGNVFIDYGEERIEIISSSGSITGDTLPIGSITAYGKETAPANWLICDGSTVSRTAYADLFAVIGTKYGEGDGSTTFNLPNLKGRVPVGLDSDDTDFNSIGKIGGEKTHTLTVKELADHSHVYTYNNNTGSFTSGDTPIVYSNVSGPSLQKNTSSVGENQPHNNLQPYQVNNFIIKAFQSVGVIAEVVNAQTESDTNVYSCNYINNLNTYSTEEKRVGTWIDGKPIYRKVVDLGNLLNNNSKTVAHDIANIDFVTSIRGIAIDTISHFSYNIPWAGTPLMLSGAIISIRADRSLIGIANTTDLSARTAYAFIEYTKTTD